MSALTITIQTLLAGSGVTALVKQRIYPIDVPQGVAVDNIIVHLVYQAEEVLLAGASHWPESRVSIECRGDAVTADKIGEAVIDWLRDKDLYVIEGSEVSFMKEGTDETDSSPASQQGQPLVCRRILDFYVRYRPV